MSDLPRIPAPSPAPATPSAEAAPDVLDRPSWVYGLLMTGLTLAVVWCVLCAAAGLSASTADATVGCMILATPAVAAAIPMLLAFRRPTAAASEDRSSVPAGPVPPHRIDVAAVRSALEGAERMAAGPLPTEAAARVSRISRQILEVLPRASELPPTSPAAFVLQRCAADYLPATLRAYLALPPTYATTHALEDGGTPAELLVRQLDLIGTSVDEIAEAVHGRDLERLLANGRFLEERLGRA